jgi:Domain of unknown function (DUF4281)
MSNQTLFEYCNLFALLAWLPLIFAPRWQYTQRIVVGIMASLLAALYVYLVFTSIQPADMQNFSTLQGVMALFTNEKGVLAGWVHYLCFDLMTGFFIVQNAMKNDVKHWFVVPCLLFTFMLGPSGLLLYLVVRAVKLRNWFEV